MKFYIYILQRFLLIVMEAATPAESADDLCTESEAAGARTEDPGLSIAREAAEFLPEESVRSNGNQHFYLFTVCGVAIITFLFLKHERASSCFYTINRSLLSFYLFKHTQIHTTIT